jgi:hypothetical protein
MNKINYIIPLVLTLGFTGLYYVHVVDAKEKAAQEQVEASKIASEALLKKQEAERQATIDADKRTAERIAEEKRKEEEKRAKWQAAGDAIAADTATYIAQAAKNEAELKALTARLAALRASKQTITQANLDFEIEIEKARITKRATELEIQRLVEMIARKGGTTTLTADAGKL